MQNADIKVYQDGYLGMYSSFFLCEIYDKIN